MGKASRVKRRQRPREKIAAQRAAQRKREIRNRMLLTGGSILGVIVIVVAFLLVKTTRARLVRLGSGSVTGTALPASVVKDITAVPASTLASVGSGTADAKSVSPVSSAAADLRRQARGALHRRRVLPVLRDRAVGHGRWR